jgi:hypothetical protein
MSYIVILTSFQTVYSISYVSIQSKPELILIQTYNLYMDQYTSPGIQYYDVSKIKQYGWLIY